MYSSAPWACKHEWKPLDDGTFRCNHCESLKHLDNHVEEPSYCEECKDTHTGKCW